MAAPAAASALEGRVARVVSGQIPALDGLRGAAIALVLAHNYNLFEGPEHAVGKVLRTAMNAGWIGVQLFFVLSGFLITGILMDTRAKKSGYRAFLARRTLRIFPLYYLVLLVAFVVLPHVRLPDGLDAGREHQAYLWLYVSNWVEPYGKSVALFPHFWSLAVEEQFYLVWPFVVRGLSTKRLAQVSLSLVVLAFVLRVAVRAETGNVEAAYTWTICRMDALALGALAAIAVRSPRAIRWLEARRRWLAPASIGGLAALFVATEGFPRTTFFDQSIGYTASAACFAVGIVALVLRQADAGGAAGAPRRSIWELAPARAIGKYSYGIYVFHLPLHLLVGEPWLAAHAAAASSLAVGLAYPLVMGAAAFAVAFVSYHVVEAPFLKLKRRFVAT